MASHDDALAEGLVGGHGEPLAQFGVSGKEEAEPVVVVHAVVGEQAEFLEQAAGGQGDVPVPGSPVSTPIPPDSDESASCVLIITAPPKAYGVGVSRSHASGDRREVRSIPAAAVAASGRLHLCRVIQRSSTM